MTHPLWLAAVVLLALAGCTTETVSPPTCNTGEVLDASGQCVKAGCTTGQHDGGDGNCVAAGSCSAGFHDDGTGKCVPQGCSTGLHDDGAGKCVAEGCASGFHDGGAGACVATGTCATGFRDNGAGACVQAGCASGFHDDGAGKCVEQGCASGFHDGGTGACVASGTCATGFHDDGTGTCVQADCASGFHDDGTGTCVASGTCATGFHDGGNGACVASGTCVTGFHDDGAGTCVATGCAAGFHDDGAGKCVASGTCATGFHDGGDGACVALTACSAGFHADGAGGCAALGVCAGGFHDGGAGACVANGDCSTGFHDDGTGACVVQGCANGFRDGGAGACVAFNTCSAGFHDDGAGQCVAQGCALGYRDGGAGECVGFNVCSAGFHDDGAGACVAQGCATGFHDGGDGTCVASSICSFGYHDDGAGQCVAQGCVAGFHDGGDGKCVAVSTCSPGFHDGGGGACVENGACSSGYHDDGLGVCVAQGCAAGYHDGGGGTCALEGACATGYHDNGQGACVAQGCAPGYHDGGDGACVLVGTCSPTGHDDGAGNCIPRFGTCAAGHHDAGDGTQCWGNGSTPNCMRGYHSGGPADTCVPYDACSPGYHTDLGGTCIPTVVCTGGEHDDGTGHCTLTGCAAGYHDSGGGTCAGSGLCLSGFHLTAAGSCEVNVVQVVAGTEHACALTSVGGVKCWGLNMKGQLGDGSTTERTRPVDVVGLASGVKSITAGDAHTCALLETGTAKCWGNNFYGQLDMGTYDPFSSVPAVVLYKQGIGTGSPTTTPLGGITSLVAGGDHTCALLQSGAVKCWGRNFQGELGGVDPNATDSPPDVMGFKNGAYVPLGKAKALGAGGYHNCAVLETGSLWCWGSNSAGELGINKKTLKEYPEVTIVAPAPGDPGVVSVTAGRQHSCATLSDGVVKCWGNNDFGQLAQGHFTETLAPAPVTGLASTVVVTAGGFHACAPLATGELQCWGSNGSGQLGDGTVVNRNLPTHVPKYQVGSSAPGWMVQTVGLGVTMTCAINVDGSLHCWGENTRGQLGDGTHVSRGTPEVVSIPCVNGYHPGGDGLCIAMPLCAAGYHDDGTGECAVQGVCAAGYHDGGDGSCVLEGACTAAYHDDGVGTCVLQGCAQGFHDGGDGTCVASTDCLPGYHLNGSGVCFNPNCGAGTHDDGTGTCVVSGCATGFHDLDGACVVDLAKLAAGSDWACALDKAGAVKCWGRNEKGQLGRGGTPNQPMNSGVAAPVLTASGKPLVGLKALAVGAKHACAVMKADGAVRCWGLNSDGQLGDGTTDTRTVATPVPGLTGVVEVAAGYSHTCALLASGAVSCWGANFWGMLGQDPASLTSSMVPVEALPAPVGNGAVQATGLYVTVNSTCALMSDGTVGCWGAGFNGELGDGTLDSRHLSSSVKTPAGTGVLSSVAGLSSGVEADHRCAVGQGGNLWCWGRRKFGQVNAAPVSGDSTPDQQELPVELLLSSGVQGVATGFRHTCAVLTTGGVECWGQNLDGILGDGSGMTPWGQTAPVMLPTAVKADASSNLSGATAVTAGQYFTCALVTTSGVQEVRCWGSSSSNQLGNDGLSGGFPAKVQGL